MHDATVEQFVQKVEKYEAVLDTITLSIAAVKVSDRWIAFCTRLNIMNRSAAAIPKGFVLPVDSRFVAVQVHYQLGELRDLLGSLVNGRFDDPALGVGEPIFLSRFHAGLVNAPVTINFGSVLQAERGYGEDSDYRPYFSILTSGPDRIYELTERENLQAISAALPLRRPAFNGMRGLLKTFGTNFLAQPSDGTDIGVIASLPFKMMGSKGSVVLESPGSSFGHMRLVYFFSPKGQAELSVASNTAETSRSTMVTTRVETPWPDGTIDASVYLYYDSDKLDYLHRLARWSGSSNWRVAVDDFFDPGHKFFEKCLKGKEGSISFEHAIVRLLALGGVPVVWYGKGREKGKPDLAGFVASHQAVTILGECTLEKPHSKLTPLKSRSAEVERTLSSEVDVIPVVFTSCDPASADYEYAARENIVLIGSRELDKLWSIVRDNATSAETLEYIRSRRGGPLVVPVWGEQPPWR